MVQRDGLEDYGKLWAICALQPLNRKQESSIEYMKQKVKICKIASEKKDGQMNDLETCLKKIKIN